MAHALAIAEKKENSSKRSTIITWLQGFFACTVKETFIPVEKDFSLYLIVMPEADQFFRKNNLGRRLTMKKWSNLLKKYDIEEVFLESTLQKYLGKGWGMEGNTFLTQSLKQDIPSLFQMDPLSRLNKDTMTLTLSGAQKEWMSSDLIQLFQQFKQINTIEKENTLADWWEYVMNETGVPICRTSDESVLERGGIWISFDDCIDYPNFPGVQVNLAKSFISCLKSKKQYCFGYVLKQEMLRKMGVNLVRRFPQHILACFLMLALMRERDCSVAFAQEFLGIQVLVVSSHLHLISQKTGMKSEKVTE